MGLDGVDLILVTEKSFGVTLNDKDIANVFTPRDLCDLVFKQLEGSDEEICQNQRAFYILRKALMQLYGLNRKDITLVFNLNTVIPKESQKEHWLKLKEVVKARSWPILLLPQWMITVETIFTLLLLALPITLSFLFLPIYITWLGFIVAIVLTVLFHTFFEKNTMQYRFRIPEKYLRVKELVQYVKTSNDIKWTRDQVQQQLKEVIIEKLGLKESQYNDDYSFVADFGLD